MPILQPTDPCRFHNQNHQPQINPSTNHRSTQKPLEPNPSNPKPSQTHEQPITIDGSAKTEDGSANRRREKKIKKMVKSEDRSDEEQRLKWWRLKTEVMKPKSLFGQTFLVTQFSSLITHHSSLKNTMFLWYHHSLPITQYFSHYLWTSYLSPVQL